MGYELKTVYEPDSGMIRSGSLGKKQKDCILPIREADGVVTDVCDLKKARLLGTTQLHHQFVAAVNALGLDKALPKKILEIMKVQHLTREQVASHLLVIYLKIISTHCSRIHEAFLYVSMQKYRLQLKRSSSWAAVESVESSPFDANEETQNNEFVVPNLSAALGQLEGVVMGNYGNKAGQSSKQLAWHDRGP
ncbi:hypothetical protein MUK42_21005 [Musa troglodytarum]|uniref:Uncharacterized protein n=1 Tax=Musa troglodytarum TaxID=320322 RepID=A0A9E7K565_9LILI|nr:hypothetical protein MUK42_21005 [Musa troglodytarum]